MSLSDAEASFLATLASEGKEIFTTRDAYEVLGEGRPARDSLERLGREDWLERIEKGKDLIVPLEAGPERNGTQDALVIARHLVEPGAIAYWSALNHRNLTEQVPRVTYVRTTARKRNRRSKVLGMEFRIVRRKRERFFGTRRDHVDRSAIKTTDREKTEELEQGAHEAIADVGEASGIDVAATPIERPNSRRIASERYPRKLWIEPRERGELTG